MDLNSPTGTLPPPALREELVISPYTFPSKCGAGPQEALVHKASIQGCHLTDSKKVLQEDGQLRVGGHGKKQRAEQIQSEHSKRKVLNHRPVQS